MKFLINWSDEFKVRLVPQEEGGNHPTLYSLQIDQPRALPPNSIKVRNKTEFRVWDESEYAWRWLVLVWRGTVAADRTVAVTLLVLLLLLLLGVESSPVTVAVAEVWSSVYRSQGRTWQGKYFKMPQVNFYPYHSCLACHRSWRGHCSWQELSRNHRDSPGNTR